MARPAILLIHVVKDSLPIEDGSALKHFLNTHQLIIFYYSLRSAWSTALNMPGIDRNGIIRYGGVLCFSGTMRDNGKAMDISFPGL